MFVPQHYCQWLTFHCSINQVCFNRPLIHCSIAPFAAYKWETAFLEAIDRLQNCTFCCIQRGISFSKGGYLNAEESSTVAPRSS